MDIRGLFRELVVAKQRREDEADRDLRQAWQIEAMQRQKKLPSLKTLLRRRPKVQSVTEQRTMLHILSEQYGGSVRPISEAARKALTHGG